MSVVTELSLPTGVLPLGAGSVTVRVTLRPAPATRTLSAGIVLAGTKAGLGYTLSTDHVLVTLGGTAAQLDHGLGDCLHCHRQRRVAGRRRVGPAGHGDAARRGDARGPQPEHHRGHGVAHAEPPTSDRSTFVAHTVPDASRFATAHGEPHPVRAGAGGPGGAAA